jgi:ATP-dependent Clp protease ATP-binding subunit ClpA
MFERFNDRARRVLVLAQEEARLLHHSFIGTEHLLLGLIHEGDGVAARALESLGVSLETVRARVEETVGQSDSPPTGSPPFTPRAKKALELSLREALQLGHNFVGTEHILLGLLREGDGVAARVLVGLGVDLNLVRQQVIALLTGDPNRQSATATSAVGDSWTVKVVRVGTTPAAYAAAHQAIANLAERLGIEIDDGRVTVISVETEHGPGLQLLFNHESRGDPSASPGGAEADESAEEPPASGL